MSSIGIKKQCEKKILEARGGIEPPIMVLQTIALPLGDRATALRSCQFSVISGQLIRKNNQESTELNEIWTGEARRECRFSPSGSLPCAAPTTLVNELSLQAVQAQTSAISGLRRLAQVGQRVFR